MARIKLSKSLGEGRRGRLLLSTLLLLATISTIQGAWNGCVRSQDFQWSGTKALVHHVDPWAEYLRGDPDHVIYMQQNPNYLPVLYILIAPVAFLSASTAKIVWVVCNFLFAVCSAVLAARFYRMRGSAVLVVICLLLMATPTRNTFGNGQQGLLVLFLWCVSLLHCQLTDVRSSIAGVSYFKFNFAPATSLYLLLRGGVRSLAISLLPSIAATGVLWVWIRGVPTLSSLRRLFLEPLLVSRTGYYPSGTDSNLMDVLETILTRGHVRPAVIQFVTLASATTICGLVLYLAVRRHPDSSIQWQMALMATLNFGLFRHHPYDAVVLLLPLCFALPLWRNIRARIVLGLIAYLWFVQRLVDRTGVTQTQVYIWQWLILMVILYLTYSLRETKAEQAADTGGSDAATLWPEIGAAPGS